MGPHDDFPYSFSCTVRRGEIPPCVLVWENYFWATSADPAFPVKMFLVKQVVVVQRLTILGFITWRSRGGSGCDLSRIYSTSRPGLRQYYQVLLLFLHWLTTTEIHVVQFTWLHTHKRWIMICIGMKRRYMNWYHMSFQSTSTLV